MRLRNQIKVGHPAQQLSVDGSRTDTHRSTLPLVHYGIYSRQASDVWILNQVTVSRAEFWYRDKRISQLCSVLPSPYKRCCVSINSLKALGQASLSKAAQQTLKKKKDTVTPPTTLLPPTVLLC